MLKSFQSLIDQTNKIISEEFGVMDESGLILSCSDEQKIGRNDPLALEVAGSSEQFVILEGFTFQKVYIKNKPEFITFIKSVDKDVIKYLSLISINVVNIKAYYDEKFDKTNLMKNIILDKILPGDIMMRAKDLHIPYNACRVAFLVKTDKTADTHVYDIIQGLFPNKSKDFIVLLDDENVALIKEVKTGEDRREIEKTARIIIDSLNAELMVKVYVGIGTVVDSIKLVGRSFNEAKMALHVGRIFENDKYIIDYNNLGIGRLIYKIPPELCELFLKEVFKDDSYESLDMETMHTIQSFFQNGLNVSETSRQLYVHRNTLVYRLDKIQKLTGLDLRKFDDAIIFKIAILVKKYINYTGE